MKKTAGSWVRRPDYAAMTGRKADAPVTSISELLKTPRKRSRGSFVQEESEEYDNGDEDDEWNVFDVVKTKTYLRPGPRESRRIRTASDDEKDIEQVLKRPRHRKSAPHSSVKSKRSANWSKMPTRGTQSFGDPLQDSSPDEGPIRQRPQNQRPLSPPTTHAPSMTPAVPNYPTVIDLEDSNEDVRRRVPTHKDREPNIKIEAANAGIKSEPLSADIISKTYLHIRADNISGRGPVRVPFSLCKTTEQLFTSLMSERKLRPELYSKVSDITATFTWNQKSFGIRKEKAEDYAFFCDSLRKAWERESHRFVEGCNIDIMIHVDEDGAYD